MTEPWPMQLSIDARDADMIRVRPLRYGTGPQVHLAVRTGPLLVYCLDGAAIASIASAWAQALASSAHLLPVQGPRRRTLSARQAMLSPHGDAFPAADVVAEGHQRWDVLAPRPGQRFTVVTTQWLTVRVHDLPALQTYTHAWAGACALALRVMPKPPPTFDQLLRDAFSREVYRQFREDHSDGRHPGRAR